MNPPLPVIGGPENWGEQSESSLDFIFLPFPTSAAKGVLRLTYMERRFPVPQTTSPKFPKFPPNFLKFPKFPQISPNTCNYPISNFPVLVKSGLDPGPRSVHICHLRRGRQILGGEPAVWHQPYLLAQCRVGPGAWTCGKRVGGAGIHRGMFDGPTGRTPAHTGWVLVSM